MPLFNFSNKNKNLIFEIYQNIVERSRSKFFYLNLKIEDNFESRFDLIVLHSFIIFYYYKQTKKDKSHLAQSLFDHMFSDFENNLREMGFGDIAVNKKMKVFISAFYGRVSIYSQGIDAVSNLSDDTMIITAIQNNLYKGRNIDDQCKKFFVKYILENINNLKLYSEEENLKKRFKLLDLPNEVS
tara:strand:- start:2022 stop:2576 length:555 start_codon:yes stop_codon:yes gene_type:complete